MKKPQRKATSKRPKSSRESTDRGAVEEEPPHADAEESKGKSKISTGLPVELIPRVAIRETAGSEEAEKAPGDVPEDELDVEHHHDGLSDARGEAPTDESGTDAPDDPKYSKEEKIREQRLRPSRDIYADLLPSAEYGQTSRQGGNSRVEELEELSCARVEQVRKYALGRSPWR